MALLILKLEEHKYILWSTKAKQPWSLIMPRWDLKQLILSLGSPLNQVEADLKRADQFSTSAHLPGLVAEAVIAEGGWTKETLIEKHLGTNYYTGVES